MNRTEKRMEAFARTIDRRTVLRGIAGGIFASMTGAMVTANPASAHAGHSCSVLPKTSSTSCSPPYSRYCTAWSSSYCSGAACAGGCTYTYNDYPDACWCTKSLVSGCYSTWWKCCDCNCSRGKCGCRHQYSSASALCLQRQAKAESRRMAEAGRH